MKKLYLILTLTIGSILPTNGQTFPSSCTAPDSVVDQYRTDAQRLALQRIFRLGTPYMDSVHIPQMQTDTILNALITVHNATTMPAHDTIINMLNIHTFAAAYTDSPYSYTLNNLYIYADGAYLWMEDLKLGVIPTSNVQVNQLMDDFGLSLDYYSDLTSGPDLAFFTSDSNYNMYALGALWNQVDPLQGGEGSVAGDDDNIRIDTITDTYVQLTYRHGWGDCPAGCIYEHFWTIRANYDCTVTYVDGGGDVIPALSVIHTAKPTALIYPNPAGSEIIVKNISAGTPYSIGSITGTIVQSGTVGDDGVIQLPIAPGIYYLKLHAHNTAVIKLTRL